ncbi:helix-turn-helix transcriptional regulator [Terrarubrum flagellatum]|uniref:helix-turn-helix domain-containing protein n=1 Tax=Terrirubrum flagellatum TaxID=2895980 RepID=UPI003144D4AB
MKMRALRAERGLTLTDMANALGVSPSYLSALERGKRSKPSWAFVQAATHYFNIIWDDAEELQRLADISAPKAKLDSSALTPRAVELANRMSRMIRTLDPADIERLHAALDKAAARQAKIKARPAGSSRRA